MKNLNKISQTLKGRVTSVPLRVKRISKFKLILIILGLLILIAGLYSLIRENVEKKASVDCNAVLQEADILYRENKPKEIYGLLIKHESVCDKDLSEGNIKKLADSQQTLTVFKYKTYLATSAYLNDDKDTAKQYAKNALEINKHMNQIQREQLPGSAILLANLNDIISNEYTYYPPENKKVRNE